MVYRTFGLRRAKRNIQAISLAKNKEIFERIHAFYHYLRDYISMIDKYNNREQFFDKATLLCNIIKEIFSKVLETEAVSVCIKCIKTESILNKDIEEWEVYTFACSTSTNQNRLNYNRADKHDKIIENTDLEIIVSDDSQFKDFNCFYSEDLDTYRIEFYNKYNKEFRNSNPPYKSEIISPIRIKFDNVSKVLQQNVEKKNYFHVIAFLCIDSEEKFIDSKNDFRFSTFNNSVYLANALGDSLYHFFESYLTKDIMKTFSDSDDKEKISKQ